MSGIRIHDESKVEQKLIETAVLVSSVDDKITINALTNEYKSKFVMTFEPAAKYNCYSSQIASMLLNIPGIKCSGGIPIREIRPVSASFQFHLGFLWVVNIDAGDVDTVSLQIRLTKIELYKGDDKCFPYACGGEHH
jgi:hypothetical protein